LRCSVQGIDQVLIGRGDERAAEPDGTILAVRVPDPKISMRHARIVRDGDRWRLEDDGSTNGTFVNGRAITSQTLADGDLLQVGRTALRLRFSLPTPAGTPRVACGD